MNCFCSMLILQMNEMRRNEAQPELQKLVSKKYFKIIFLKKNLSVQIKKPMSMFLQVSRTECSV